VLSGTDLLLYCGVVGLKARATGRDFDHPFLAESWWYRVRGSHPLGIPVGALAVLGAAQVYVVLDWERFWSVQCCTQLNYLKNKTSAYLLNLLDSDR